MEQVSPQIHPESSQNPRKHPGIFTYILIYVQSYRHELMHFCP